MGRFGLLPGEIRNEIYRYLLRHDDILPENPKHHNFSHQILATCRQIHCEALSILWHENTWRLELLSREAYKTDPVFPSGAHLHRVCSNVQTDHMKVHPRRFHINLRDCYEYEDGALRTGMRETCNWLMTLPEIEMLRLTVGTRGAPGDGFEMSQRFGSRNWEISRDWVKNPMFRTWLTQVRNVKEVVIDDRIPEEMRTLIRDAWRSSEKLDEFPEAYNELCKTVRKMLKCREPPTWDSDSHLMWEVAKEQAEHDLAVAWYFVERGAWGGFTQWAQRRTDHLAKCLLAWRLYPRPNGRKTAAPVPETQRESKRLASGLRRMDLEGDL
ncbi:hypothetical protein B0T16DRAFT_449881 [Cercophora newfieldiana]|uniref:Uncharacterized protein n=1 Tax=Cercophora newfieldiana TaxID=92897 RepID=A0AA40CHJ2_9PEZI|nr:hypothetical protein B0T16DRAFT_449881 [Cercophora newfieldiana]